MARVAVGVLISGRGSNLQALLDAAAEPGYPAKIVLVISNRPGASGLERAERTGVPTRVIDHRDFPDRPAFETALTGALREAGAEAVCLAGFMRVLTGGFVGTWQGRLLNIHPSLLPLFPGLHTHARALAAGVLKHFLRDQMKAGTKVKRYEFRGVDEDGYGSSKRPSGATDKARGWGYTYGGRVTGSMTTGGISSLAICRSELLDNRSYDGALSRHVDQSIRDGVAWLGKEFSVTQNPGLPAWHYYYLYGLERAGVLSGIHLMERHDWYGDGAEFLVKAQQSDGGWMSQAQFGMQPPRGRGGKVSTIQETCFALLFLKRATFTVKAKGTPTESEDDDFDLSGAPDLDDASFQPVFDAVFLRFRQADVKRRRILATDFVRLGVRAIPLLLRCVDDDAPIVRKAAVAALRNVTGRSYGLPVGDKRSQVVANWEQWWVAIRGRVTADTAAGRFVVAEKPALKAPTSGD